MFLDMKRLVVLIILGLYGQAPRLSPAAQDPKDPRFFAVPGEMLPPSRAAGPVLSPSGSPRTTNNLHSVVLPAGQVGPASAARPASNVPSAQRQTTDWGAVAGSGRTSASASAVQEALSLTSDEQVPKDSRTLVLQRKLSPAAKEASSSVSSANAGGTNEVVLPPTAGSMALLDNQQKLGPGDRVSYRVIEDQDDPRSLTVTDSGDLEVPYYGLVHAVGKTSFQLASEIKALLEQKLYKQATVIIALELVNKTRVTGKVYVTGQVRNRGGYEIPAGETLTVSKAILNAGGFSDFSDKKHVRLIRNTAKGKETFTENVLDVWDKSKLEEDLVVQPGDTIVVPERLLNY